MAWLSFLSESIVIVGSVEFFFQAVLWSRSFGLSGATELSAITISGAAESRAFGVLVASVPATADRIRADPCVAHIDIPQNSDRCTGAEVCAFALEEIDCFHAFRHSE